MNEERECAPGPGPARRTVWAGLSLVLALVAACGAPSQSQSQSVLAPTPSVLASAPPTVAPSTALPGPQPIPETAPVVPVRVQVPAIGVDVSGLEALRRGPGGELVPPVDFDRAGYYVDGPAPGDSGPAVIAGHVDDTSGPKVFFRLRDLHPGDEVRVTRSDTRVVTFRVDAVEQYPKGAFPTAAVYGPQPGASLRLITCGGSFDRSVRSYRDNIVVYASEVG